MAQAKDYTLSTTAEQDERELVICGSCQSEIELDEEERRTRRYTCPVCGEFCDLLVPSARQRYNRFLQLMVVGFSIESVVSSALVALIFVLLDPSKGFLQQMLGAIVVTSPPTIVASLGVAIFISKRVLSRSSQDVNGPLVGFGIKVLSCFLSILWLMMLADHRGAIGLVEGMRLAYLFFPLLVVGGFCGAITGLILSEEW